MSQGKAPEELSDEVYLSICDASKENIINIPSNKEFFNAEHFCLICTKINKSLIEKGEKWINLKSCLQGKNKNRHLLRKHSLKINKACTIMNFIFNSK